MKLVKISIVRCRFKSKQAETFRRESREALKKKKEKSGIVRRHITKWLMQSSLCVSSDQTSTLKTDLT